MQMYMGLNHKSPRKDEAIQTKNTKYKENFIMIKTCWMKKFCT